MKKSVSTLAISAALLMMFAGAAQAIITQYDDITYGGTARSVWASALTIPYVFTCADFSNPPAVPPESYGIMHTGTVISDGTVNVNVNSTNTSPLFGITRPGVPDWYDQVARDPSGNVLTKTTFTFNAPNIYAAGFDADLSPLDYGQGLLFTIIYGDGTRVVAGSIIPQDNGDGSFGPVPQGFWGWISTDALGKDLPISALEITSADWSPGRDFETFFLQSLTYAEAVPEPSTFILLGAGLSGLILWRRRS
jgi:hypothetical protein